MIAKGFALVATASLALGATQALALPVIDDFTTPQRVTDLPGGGTPQFLEVAAPEALGGWRDMWVETDGIETSNTTFDVFGGVLSFSNDTGVTGRAELTYDGADGARAVNTTGLGGVNFLIGPNPLFSFDVASFESNLDFKVEVWDMFGNTAFYEEVLPPAGLFSPDLPFSDFTLDPGFDWTQVGALQFRIESLANGYDGSIDSISIEAIPLPAPALLLLSGVGLLGLRRFRRA